MEVSSGESSGDKHVLQPATDPSAPPPLASSAESGTPEQPPFPFVSLKPMIGDPPATMRDYMRPRLRRFPYELKDLDFDAYLGKGVDGVVVRAKLPPADDSGTDALTVAVKIFRDNAQPPPKNVGEKYAWPSNLECQRLAMAGRPIPRKPAPPKYLRFYWAFKRECRNAALLEKIASRIKAEPPVYFNSEPVMWEDVEANLRAFSLPSTTNATDDACSQQPPPEEREGRWTVFPASELNLVHCHGWLTIKGRQIAKLLRHTPAADFKINDKDDIYYAIVYDYIPGTIKGEPPRDLVNQQKRLFFQLGFIQVPAAVGNWRGTKDKLTLVDHSDLISPVDSWWRHGEYERDARLFWFPEAAEARNPVKPEPKRETYSVIFHPDDLTWK